jgi:hypothetical protein
VNGLIEPNDSINACKGILPPTLAYTMPWIDNKDKASQIQLCPWLLNWAKKLDGLIAENKVDKKGKYVEKIANKMVEHDFVLSPIDIESVLDKLILHEMQHTKVANLAVDMDESSVKKIKYGWKRCRALAKEGDISQLRRPDTNADSIALAGFGTVASLDSE